RQATVEPVNRLRPLMAQTDYRGNSPPFGYGSDRGRWFAAGYRQVDLNLTAQSSFRTDGEDVTDDQHQDNQDRINGRATNRWGNAAQLVVDPAQVENRRNLAYQMISGHRLIEIERIE